MKSAVLFASIAGILSLPTAAHAEFNYTTIDAGFVDVEIDTGFGTVDGDGYRFRGAYEVSNSFFLEGTWEEQSFDFGVDGRRIELGGGYHHPLSTDLDFIASAAFVQAEIEAGGFGFDDDGINIGGGIRARLGDSFQVEAMLDWVDFDEGGSDTGIGLLGRYYFNDQFAISLETEFDDDVDTYTMGFRAEF